MIRVFCPRCHKAHRLDNQMVGHAFACAECGCRVRVPSGKTKQATTLDTSGQMVAADKNKLPPARPVQPTQPKPSIVVDERLGDEVLTNPVASGAGQHPNPRSASDPGWTWLAIPFGALSLLAFMLSCIVFATKAGETPFSLCLGVAVVCAGLALTLFSSKRELQLCVGIFLSSIAAVFTGGVVEYCSLGRRARTAGDIVIPPTQSASKLDQSAGDLRRVGQRDSRVAIKTVYSVSTLCEEVRQRQLDGTLAELDNRMIQVSGVVCWVGQINDDGTYGFTLTRFGNVNDRDQVLASTGQLPKPFVGQSVTAVGLFVYDRALATVGILGANIEAKRY